MNTFLKNFRKLCYTVALLVIFMWAHGALYANAATNIEGEQQWAWNDVIGWIDFYSTQTVTVSDTELSGYAESDAGYIALNCKTPPSGGDICDTSNFKVISDGDSDSDGWAKLSGWAWSDAIGWISFSSVTGGGSVEYEVTINSETGEFSGWAWNDAVGWISFNCGNVAGSCTSSNYLVKTQWSLSQGGITNNWLVSSTLDTCLVTDPTSPQEDCGVALNTIMWQGTSPDGARVDLQIATECVGGIEAPPNCSEWNFLGPTGVGSTYQVTWNTPAKINQQYHKNIRYFRYKIFFHTGGTNTAKVEDVIVNWSP